MEETAAGCDHSLMRSHGGNALNQRSTNAARFALKGVALAAACLWGTQAAALGLGRLAVQSALGETLKAEIDVTSMTPEEASSLKLRIAPPESYRSAGVEYNAALTSAQVQVVRRPDGRQVLRVTSDRAVLEPFVDVIIEATWASGRLVREYTMLFDPPGSRVAQAAAPATAPVIAPTPAAPATPAAAASPAPTAPPPVAAAPAPVPTQVAAPVQRAPRPAAAETAKPATASAAAASGGDQVRVRQGDSLSRIAGRTQRQGVSLDQMLVSLFRANPQAFVGDNMNRLRSGSVLTVPAADDAGKTSPQEARSVILAQSNDFAAYRQRLASGATTAADVAPARQVAGKVQTQVEDRKQPTATTPDRLTLSQGGVKASAPEANASKAAERKDNGTRLAELSRNVDELKKLQGTAAPAAAPLPKPAPAPVASAAVAAVPAKTTAPALAPVPAPVTAPASAAPLPTPAVVAAAPSPTPAATPAPAVVAAASAPVPAAKPPAPVAEEPGLIESLQDNALLLPAAGVLVALLAGLGLYRLRARRKPAGETSFLESRLQPDSFFGASGGQRIDTRDGGNTNNAGASSSMSYSLSQLDAIGDVDPVAEADVYLAYGRDLQAEEILKEAMRSTPERMAIRSKLLEVYAKRRDTKGFELLASQMFNLTRGEGEDWSKAQALGLTIDPTNVLYQPGGAPDEVRTETGQVVEVLGAPTQPYTAPVQPPAFKPADDAHLDAPDSSLDLDLDLALPDMPVLPTEATQPFTTAAALGGDDTLDFSLDGEEPKTVPVKRGAPELEPTTMAMPKPKAMPAPATDGLDFDLGDMSLDPPTVAVPVPSSAAAPAAADVDFGDFGIGSDTPPDDLPPENDPLARKIELAEEFRQIGDLEGARDLLEEVIAKSEGSLKAKAEGMLDKLG
jgi:pilus assembly protein FimV